MARPDSTVQRSSCPHLEELKNFLEENEWRQLAIRTESLNFLMLQMGADLQRCLNEKRIDGPIAAIINSTLPSMMTVVTGCEQIRNTPVPFSDLLLQLTVYLYCFLRTFGIVGLTEFMTPLVVAIVAYTFSGLDALGDETFGIPENDLPLDAICRTPEIELRQSSTAVAAGRLLSEMTAENILMAFSSQWQRPSEFVRSQYKSPFFKK